MLRDIFKDIIEKKDKELIYNKFIKNKLDQNSLEKKDTNLFKQNDFLIKFLYEVFESVLKNKYYESDNEIENKFKKEFILNLVDLREKVEINKNYENFNKDFYLLTEQIKVYMNNKKPQFKENITAIYYEIHKTFEDNYERNKGTK